MLAPLLQEIGIAVRLSQNQRQGVLVYLYILLFGGLGDRDARGGIGKCAPIIGLLASL